MPQNQQQYQVRLTIGLVEEVSADIVVWADAFAESPQPSRVVHAVSLRNRSAVARDVLAEQERRSARTSVLVAVASGLEPGELPVANIAVAGAFIEALGGLGIDHTSPEAAAAVATWLGIAPVRHHLLSATTAARRLAASVGNEALVAALQLDEKPRQTH